MVAVAVALLGFSYGGGIGVATLSSGGHTTTGYVIAYIKL